MTHYFLTEFQNATSICLLNDLSSIKQSVQFNDWIRYWNEWNDTTSAINTSIDDEYQRQTELAHERISNISRMIYTSITLLRLLSKNIHCLHNQQIFNLCLFHFRNFFFSLSIESELTHEHCEIFVTEFRWYAKRKLECFEWTL